MVMLSSGGALEHYTSLRGEAGRVEGEVQTLSDRLVAAERIESTKTDTLESETGITSATYQLPTRLLKVLAGGEHLGQVVKNTHFRHLVMAALPPIPDVAEVCGECQLWADFDEKGFDLPAFGFRPSLSRSAFQAG